MTATRSGPFYAEDLSHVHHHGYGAFARGAAPGVIQALRAAGIHGGLIIDLGCGSGILAGELLAAGYSVLGVDVSPAMLDLARPNAPGAQFRLASLHTVDLPPCTAIVALGEAISYGLPLLSDVQTLFRRCFEALRPGGLFAFDVVIRNQTNPMSYTACSEGIDWRVETTVEEEPERSLLTRRIKTYRRIGTQQRSSEEVHLVRTFERNLVEERLRVAGFSVKVADSYGSQTLPPQRLCFFASKAPSIPTPMNG